MPTVDIYPSVYATIQIDTSPIVTEEWGGEIFTTILGGETAELEGATWSISTANAQSHAWSARVESGRSGNSWVISRTILTFDMDDATVLANVNNITGYQLHLYATADGTANANVTQLGDIDSTPSMADEGAPAAWNNHNFGNTVIGAINWTGEEQTAGYQEAIPIDDAASALATAISAQDNFTLGLQEADYDYNNSEGENAEAFPNDTTRSGGIYIFYDDTTRRPFIRVTYTESGYTHLVNGVAAANISNVNGVATANISKVMGV